MPIRYIDLFAGIGGFHYGIDVATATRNESRTTNREECSSDINNSEMGTQQFTCVYSNEWDKYANSIYRKHFGECDDRDIRSVPTSDIPDHDLLVGGFPCQAFSVAGKRGGFDDTRGTLFFEIARILRDKRPRYLVLENVKGLLSHDSGKTFQTILGVLSDIGYGVQWQVLNSKDFGVPQSRERVYIVGHFRGEARTEVFPIRRANEASIIQMNQPRHSNNRIFSSDGLSPTLNTMQGGNRQPKVSIPVLTPDRAEKRQNGRRFKTNGEPSFTLTSQDRHGIYDGAKIRRLTPVECERLQGFSDNWTEGISDTQRYKCLGNAVTTNVITEIIKRL